MLVLIVLVAFLAAGCAGVDQPLGTDLESPDAATRDCAQWFAALDGVVDRAGVRDGGAYRIPGFPYLRVDRFSASFGAAATTDSEAFAVSAARLRQLDATARAYELKNLSAAQLEYLGVPDAALAAARSDRCAEELGRRDLASPAQAAELVGRAHVPDDYLEWNRVLGLYPIAGIPFSIGVARWHIETIDAFRREAASDDPAAEAIRYAPAGRPLGAARVRAILAHGRADRLGIRISALLTARRCCKASPRSSRSRPPAVTTASGRSSGGRGRRRRSMPRVRSPTGAWR